MDGEILTIKERKYQGETEVVSARLPSDLVDELNALADIDWIMVTDDCISVSNCRICDEKINGAYSSDHFPVYAELTVFVPEGGIHHAFGEVLPEFDDKWLEAEKDKEGEKFGNLHRIP